MGQQTSLTDCSRLESNIINIFNETLNESITNTTYNITSYILIPWNEANKIGFMAGYYWRLPLFWIPCLIILFTSCFIPYIAFNSYHKRIIQREIKLKNLHKRSEVYEIFTAYFGNNDDFLIFIILDYANITKPKLNEVLSLKLDYYNEFFSANNDPIILSCIGIAPIILSYILLYHFSVSLHYTTAIFTPVDITGNYTDYTSIAGYDYNFIKESSMRKICDPQSIDINKYKFMVEHKKYECDWFYIHRFELNFAVATDAAIEAGLTIGPIAGLCCISLSLLVLNFIKKVHKDTKRISEFNNGMDDEHMNDEDMDDEDMDVEIPSMRVHETLTYTKIDNDVEDEN